jgi:hypothetical protein
MRIVASFIGVLVLLLLLPVPAQAEPVGRITCVEGRVEIVSPGQTPRPAHIGAQVYRGDIIRTKSRAKTEITFRDAAIMRLAQKSGVEISDSMTGKGMRRGGMGLFRVKIGSAASTFLRIASFSRNPCESPYTAVAGVR